MIRDAMLKMNTRTTYKLKNKMQSTLSFITGLEWLALIDAERKGYVIVASQLAWTHRFTVH